MHFEMLAMPWESRSQRTACVKIGATRAANNGATVAELEAIFGWQGGGMASLYTRAADRARLAKAAISKLDRTPSEQYSRTFRKGAGARTRT